MKITINGDLPTHEDIDGVPDEFLNPYPNPEHISTILPRMPIIQAAQGHCKLLDKTPYRQRCRQCFTDVYRFFDKHKQPRTDEDWDCVVKDMELYKDPFTKNLITAVVCEFERDYEENANV